MSNLRVGQICIITTNDSWIGQKGVICKILIVDGDSIVFVKILKCRGGFEGKEMWETVESLKAMPMKYYYGKV